MKAILIDDEPLARTILREYLADYPDVEIVAECDNGFEGIKAVQQHRPDLLFLDIQMPKINGFEMLELIDQPPAVVFTTAFDEYALKAFEKQAVDYLLKPFSRERFDRAMANLTQQDKAAAARTNVTKLMESAQKSPAEHQRVVVKLAGKIKIIPVEDILYFEAADDYVKIHTNEASFLKNKTMGHFESVLPEAQFVRTHRSYIVNIGYITRIDPYEKESYLAQLRTGQRVPVSKTGYAKLKTVLGL